MKRLRRGVRSELTPTPILPLATWRAVSPAEILAVPYRSLQPPSPDRMEPTLDTRGRIFEGDIPREDPRQSIDSAT